MRTETTRRRIFAYEVLHAMRGPILYSSSLIIGVVVGLSFFHDGRRPVMMGMHHGKLIPEGGIVTDPQGHTEVVNPENGKKGLAKIYKALVSYKKTFGQLPDSEKQLFDHGLSPDDLNNPDTVHADGMNETLKPPSYMMKFIEKRADGTSKSQPTALAGRDVWAVTGTYVRRNIVKYRDLTSKINVEGFYLVLWSDGKIEEVKPQDALMVRNPASKRVMLCFRGEAGVKSNMTPVSVMKQRANLRS